MVYNPGDWVWLHMRPERFPRQRKSKLDPRGDGPFRVLERINDNAYKLELPEEVKISTTFNVSDLSPFAMDEGTLGEDELEEGGNDEDIDTLTPQTIPTLREAPRTRQGYKRLREEFDQGITNLLILMDQQDPFKFEEEGPLWNLEHLKAFGPEIESQGFGLQVENNKAQDQEESSPSPPQLANSPRHSQKITNLLTINAKAPPT